MVSSNQASYTPTRMRLMTHDAAVARDTFMPNGDPTMLFIPGMMWTVLMEFLLPLLLGI